MVKGLDRFREFLKGFEGQYVLIGGAACDILFASCILRVNRPSFTDK